MIATSFSHLLDCSQRGELLTGDYLYIEPTPGRFSAQSRDRHPSDWKGKLYSRFQPQGCVGFN
jgi:hypothetical protein